MIKNVPLSLKKFRASAQKLDAFSLSQSNAGCEPAL